MEDEDVDRTLKQILKTAKDNNRILRKMRSYQRLSSFVRIFYWIVIIGSALGLYYFFQPYFDGLKDTYSAFGDFINNPKEFISNALNGE